MKRTLAFFLCLVLLLAMTPALADLRAEAETSGYYEYSVSGSKATITKYTGSASTVTIPSTLGGYTVTAIDETAFWCNETLTSVTIPSSVKTIGNAAFEDCEKLKTVTLNSGLETIEACAFACTGLTSVTIPSSVKTIGYAAFEDCEKLKTVTLNSGLETIEACAFRNCILLTKITFPSSLLSIGEEAFACTGLTSVTISQSVKTIGDNPFANCESIASFAVNSSNSYFTAKSGVLFSKDGTRLVAYPQGKSDTSYQIPSGTTTVCCEAFTGALHLTKITIPTSVITIEGFAFSDCYDLTTISLPSSLKTLGGFVFCGCSALTSLKIPAATTSIGNGISSGSNIRSFTVDSGNTEYTAADGILYNKAKTKIVSYPAAKTASSFTAASTVTSTEEYAFVDCIYLNTISLPGLKTMGCETFSGCTALKNFNIPTGLSEISEGAFEFCSSLKTVTIPSNILSIGGWAYYGCESLTSITIPASVKAVGENAFDLCSQSLVIKCTSGSAAYYYAKAEGISYQLTDVAKPSITTQPSSVTSAVNVTVNFKVVASGSGLSYQWQYSTDNGKTWNNSGMTGYNTATLKVPVIAGRNGYLYRCVVKNSAGSVTSSSAKLTVSGVKPTIRSQTNAITSAADVTAVFKVAAAGTGLSYKWQYSTDNGKTWHNSGMTGYNTSTLKVPVISGRNGYLYRCTVTNSVGSVTSSPAKLTVSGVKPVIRDQTKAITSSPNVTVTFKVAAAGVGLKYKWQYSGDGGKTWHDSTMTGYNTAAMKVPVTTARNGYQYRCIVSNSYGSVTSSPAKLTVK